MCALTMYKVEGSTRSQVLESFGKTPESAKEDVAKVKKWMQGGNFPETMDDASILNFLQLNKFNTEKTRAKIGCYYSIPPKYPKFFAAHDPGIFEVAYFCNHPELVDDTSRLTFIKLKKPGTFNPEELFRMFFNLFEVRLLEDCMVTDIFVFHMDNISFFDVLKVTPKMVYQTSSTYRNIYSFRTKAVLVLNCPAYISIWLTLAKMLLPRKLFDRIRVCSDEKAMEEVLPKGVLPKEYGGDGPSLGDLNGMTKRKMEEYEWRFRDLKKMREVKRI